MSNPHAKKTTKKQAPKQQPGSVAVLPRFQRKRSFKDFKALAQYAKGMVYLIVRIRSVNGQTYWRSLGTGFLAGDHRLITCYHCINDDDHPNDQLMLHEDGDMYLLVQKDEFNNFHQTGVVATENTDLFLYKNIDTAVFHLNDNFYQSNGQYFKHPDMFLEFSNDTASIGSEMGILGYPFANLTFDAQGNADISTVHIRADKGVVNTSYEISGLHVYEFTTSFNPGNSGGPILDAGTGAVIGIVDGYRPIPTHWVEDTIPAGKIGNAQEVKHAYQLRTIYSLGISSRTLLTLDKQHSLGKR